MLSEIQPYGLRNHLTPMVKLQSLSCLTDYKYRPGATCSSCAAQLRADQELALAEARQFACD